MAADNIERLKREVAQLPLDPGVYQYLDRNGKVIYVGKAKSLRRRVSSYFVDSREHSAKVKVLVKQIAEIRHIVVDSEADALLLENSLIKTLQPKYNILLKDDKTYPWIVVRNEPFPRVESTRRLVRDGSLYFGPYASVVMQKSLLELIHSIYPLRTCALKLSAAEIARGKYGVCLQYHLGNCRGPCVGRQSTEEYAESIRMITAMLRGDLRTPRTWLVEQMEREAAELRFESAERYRQRLASLDNYSGKSVIVNSNLTNLDVFSLLTDDADAYCNFTRIVSGSVVNTFTVQLSTGADEEDREKILTTAIREISERISGRLAREVIVPFLPDTAQFEGVSFTVPRRGDKLKLLEFSEKGARIYRAERLKNLEIKDPERHSRRLLEALQKALGLASPPRRIECFDNSNLQGSNAVASCVVFRDCRPAKSEYRHFNIRTVQGPDDYASMREAVSRRYTRLRDEGAELPDLIIADGGRGQMEAIRHVVEDELGLTIPIAGLAKDSRHRTAELLYGFPPKIVGVKPASPLFHLLENIQNEVHRFAIAHHRNKRSKAFISSELESIEGIGPASVKELLRHFRTVSAVRRASMEELTGVVGPARAKRIHSHFNR